MGRAFDATQGELAEKLYSALIAGDTAGRDSRGRQSASILVVCQQCGRNTNNDRYLYINVDDNLNPFPELRRLLNQALAYNYTDGTYKLMERKRYAEARAAAEKALHYNPNNSDSHMTLGFLDYLMGDKPAALAELRKAKQLDRDFRKQWNAEVEFFGQLAHIKQDKEFLKKLFPE